MNVGTNVSGMDTSIQALCSQQDKFALSAMFIRGIEIYNYIHKFKFNSVISRQLLTSINYRPVEYGKILSECRDKCFGDGYFHPSTVQSARQICTVCHVYSWNANTIHLICKRPGATDVNTSRDRLAVSIGAPRSSNTQLYLVCLAVVRSILLRQSFLLWHAVLHE